MMGKREKKSNLGFILIKRDFRLKAIVLVEARESKGGLRE